MKLREADFIMPAGEYDTVINCDGNPSVSAFRAKDIANKSGIHKDIFNHKQRKSVLYSEMYAVYKALHRLFVPQFSQKPVCSLQCATITAYIQHGE